MKAFVTSIGEPTTRLCVDQLEKHFEVVLIEDQTSLADKLELIYNSENKDFIRVDGDVIPNKNLTPQFISMLYPDKVWWVQFLTFDWFKQDTTHGGVQFIKAQAIPHLREAVREVKNDERPETSLFRLQKFENPRRCVSHETIMGIHNYKNDIKRVRATKERRNQDGYDWELAEKMNEL